MAVDPQQRGAPAVLEDPDQDPVGRADRQQVQQDRLQGYHDRTEADQQQQERQRQHEPEHQRGAVAQLVDEVAGGGGLAGNPDLDAGELAEGGRDGLAA
jgi:hypothetical protein